MRRGAARVALALGVAVAVSALAWPVYGWRAFLHSLEILAPLGVVTTVLAETLAGRRLRTLGVRRRLGALAALAVLQLGVALALFAALMFVSRHDAFFMALAAGYAALIAVGAGRLVASGALADLDAIRHAVALVGEGERTVEIPVSGVSELATLAADVEAMVVKLAAAEHARRSLVAAVSHDLRTPITTLRLIAEGLEDNIFEPDLRRDQLASISTHLRALSALVDDLFELSRLEAGDIRWTIEQVPLAELLRETVEAMRPQADAGGIVVRTELEQLAIRARANPEQLQRVLFNLIQNAIRHTPPDGSVVVRVAPAPGPAVEIEVADEGDGIEPALRERIFEPFVQGPSRVAGEHGSAGLGLAIARAIVEAHGGRIWLADSAPGTRVRFSLPAA